MDSLQSDTSLVELSIIIVNWHSAEYVAACLSALPDAARTVRYEVIVVDNASFDTCGDLVALEWPALRFIQCTTNLGFGAANNFAAGHARGHAVLFLNPDTVPSIGSIDRLYTHALRTADAGVLGPRLLNTNGTLQTSCVQALPTVLNQLLDVDVLRRALPHLRLWRTQALYEHSPTPVTVDAVSGACMLVRRSVFESLGGFCTDFFMYGEDLDLCARVAAAGHRVLFDGDSHVVHHGGGSSRQAPSAFSILLMCDAVSRLITVLRGTRSRRAYRFGLTMSAALRLALLIGTAPLWALSRARTRWLGAARKWLTIFRWGLGLARLHRHSSAAGAR